MKILFIGDIYGEAGIKILEHKIKEIKDKYSPNFIIANGENVTKGRGINKDDYKKLMNLGISAVTMGNWTWSNKELKEFIEESNIIRPINHLNAPGVGYKLFKFNQKTILVINALGRTFMDHNLENPFILIKKTAEEIKADYKIVDFHAEASSEKMALAYYLDGVVDAVLGTHTHVPTADERVLDKKTLYITDVGMTGPLEGVIGVKKENAIERFLTGISQPHDVVTTGKMQINAVLLDFSNEEPTIERINIKV